MCELLSSEESDEISGKYKGDPVSEGNMSMNNQQNCFHKNYVTS